MPSGSDGARVRLITAIDPLPGGLGRATVCHVPGHEPFQPHGVRQVDVPALGQQGSHPHPCSVVQQQVVALDDDQRRRGIDADRAGDRLLDLASEQRRVHDVGVGAVRGRLLSGEPAQQGDEPGRVKGFRCSLALSATEAFQLGLGEVVAIHRDDHGRARGQRVDQGSGQRGLAAARGTGQPQQPTRPGAEQPPCPLDGMFEIGARRGGRHPAILAGRAAAPGLLRGDTGGHPELCECGDRGVCGYGGQAERRRSAQFVQGISGGRRDDE